jgi:hypothetical protein
MKTMRDQLRQAKRDLKKEDRRSRAEARSRAERDDWKSFKKECVELKNRRG